MRVATKTMYDAIRFELGNIIEDLYKASKVVTTGKRINNLSDDPVGLIQFVAAKNGKLRQSAFEIGKRDAAVFRWRGRGDYQDA